MGQADGRQEKGSACQEQNTAGVGDKKRAYSTADDNLPLALSTHVYVGRDGSGQKKIGDEPRGRKKLIQMCMGNPPCTREIQKGPMFHRVPRFPLFLFLLSLPLLLYIHPSDLSQRPRSSYTLLTTSHSLKNQAHEFPNPTLLSILFLTTLRIRL